MKLKVEDTMVMTNTKNQKEFTIKASAKAFQILSSGLYERKIEAIVRELSCNAYDSHVVAGYPDRPFRVHLPNAWEPEFSVEDFGVGLSSEEIEDIYTSYFTSTKTDSNDVIGALGLGSKSPFAYTDTFTVQSRKDGIECVYTAYIGEGGQPTVALMHKKKTDEPNGVKVTLPVAQADFFKFVSAADIVYRWFKVLPEVIGTDRVFTNEEALKLIDNDVVFDYNGGNQVITAVMGNVAYHVNLRHQELPLSDSVKIFTNRCGLTIRFDIGDLDIAASRETISFDDDTTKVFVEKVNSAVKAATEELQQNVDNAKSIAEAIRTVKEFSEWALPLVSYKGITVDRLDGIRLHQPINNILEFDQRRGGYITDTKVGIVHYYGSNKISNTVESYARYESYTTNCKHIFIKTASVGTDRALKRILNDYKKETKLTNYKLFFYLYKGHIDPAVIEAAKEEFGEERVVSCTVDEYNTMIRAEMAEARKANAANRKKPIAIAERIKKHEFRCDVVFKVVDGKFIAEHDVKVDAEDVTAKSAIVSRYRNDLELLGTGQFTTEYTINGNKESNEEFFSLMKSTGADAVYVIKEKDKERVTSLITEDVLKKKTFDLRNIAVSSIVSACGQAPDDWFNYTRWCGTFRYVKKISLDYSSSNLVKKFGDAVLDGELGYLFDKTLLAENRYSPNIVNQFVTSQQRQFINHVKNKALDYLAETLYNLVLNYPLMYDRSSKAMDEYVAMVDKLNAMKETENE